jgi:hypothetical protein
MSNSELHDYCSRIDKVMFVIAVGWQSELHIQCMYIPLCATCWFEYVSYKYICSVWYRLWDPENYMMLCGFRVAISPVLCVKRERLLCIDIGLFCVYFRNVYCSSCSTSDACPGLPVVCLEYVHVFGTFLIVISSGQISDRNIASVTLQSLEGRLLSDCCVNGLFLFVVWLWR